MGFMDKAKKLAEQAQQKIDETQKQFNERQSGEQPQGEGGRFDEHGRPIRDTEAGADPPDTITPVEPSAPPAKDEGPGRSSSGSGAPPDPFKPLQ